MLLISCLSVWSFLKSSPIIPEFVPQIFSSQFTLPVWFYILSQADSSHIYVSSLILPLSSLFINPLAFWIPPLRFLRGFSNPVCPKFILFSSTPSQYVLLLYSLCQWRTPTTQLLKPETWELFLIPLLLSPSWVYPKVLQILPSYMFLSLYLHYHSLRSESDFPLAWIITLASCFPWFQSWSLNPSRRWLPSWIKFKLLISHTFNDLATAFSGFTFYFSYVPPTSYRPAVPELTWACHDFKSQC